MAEEEIKYLMQNSHLSYKILAKNLDRTWEAVRHKFRQYQIKKIRAPHKTYYVNESYFEKWSHNMAYLFGLIFADGNIRSSKTRSAELRFCNSN